MAGTHFSVRDMQYSYHCNGFTIVTTTDVPCHLWIRWTSTPPRIHKKAVLRRGLRINDDVRFCFVTYIDKEQDEAGDTLTHTFTLSEWPVCQTRYFYFTGEILNVSSPSTTGYFSLHFDINIADYLGSDSNRLIWNRSVNWAACHGAAMGQLIFIGPAPNYRIAASALLTATYQINRAYLFFNTASLPAGTETVGGYLSLWIISWLRTSSAAFPNINITQGVQSDPIILANYGHQLPYTTSGGERDLATLIAFAYNNIQLNSNALPWIVPGGITRLCIRQEMDLVNTPPPLGNNQAVFCGHQAGFGYRPILTLCHPPANPP